MRMNRPYLLFLIGLLSIGQSGSAQQKRMVEFVGAARSVLSNDGLTVRDSVPDTTTVGRSSGGYAQIDLGVDIQPNKSTEIMGMFRIRNQYGGFWGAGVTFDVRQLWLKGVIGDYVRYQVGDLNLQQTRFTLYNAHADRYDSLPAVFSLQSDIVDYERFYTGNTWRQQGVNVDFGLEFAKGIKEINFTGYVTRMNATDFTAIPDRLLAGFSAVVVQQEGLDIGFHKATVFDVQGTAASLNQFVNDVNSATLNYTRKGDGWQFDVQGEAGKSRYENTEYADQPVLSDYFLYSQATWNWTRKHVRVDAGYLNIGPDFRSSGSQTKDIDYTALPDYFDRYTNEQVLRPLSISDYLQNENLYTTSVSKDLMAINPAINNISPYGDATFNRLGGFIGAGYDHPKGLTVSFKHTRLREIRGQGTLALKQFSRTQLNVLADVGRMMGTKRALTVHAGADMQQTNRNGNLEIENVSLTSARYHAGVEWEAVKRLDVMAGWISLSANGNEFTADRDGYTLIDYFQNVDYDLKENSVACGLRYRFDPRIYLCALYQSSRYDDRVAGVADYTIDRFALIYSMTF